MSASVRAVPQCEAEGAGGQLGGDAHGGEDVARLEGAAGTGRPARDAHPLLAEGDQQLLPLDARDAQVQVPREDVDRRRPPTPSRCAPSTAASSPSPSRSRRAATRGAAVARSAATRRSAVASPTAPATSWVPLRRSRSCPPPYWRASSTTRPFDRQRTDPDRPADLVRAERHQSAPAVSVGQVEVRRRLHGVGEDGGLRGAPAHRRRRCRTAAGRPRSRCWPS